MFVQCLCKAEGLNCRYFIQREVKYRKAKIKVDVSSLSVTQGQKGTGKVSDTNNVNARKCVNVLQTNKGTQNFYWSYSTPNDLQTGTSIMAQILYIMVVSSFTLVLTGYDSGQVLMLISSSAFNPHKSRLEGWLFYNCSDLKWFVSCFVLTHSHTLNKFPGILFCWHNTLHTQQTLLCTNNHAHYFAHRTNTTLHI